MIPKNKFMNGEKVLFGAHRGDRTNFPENTMPAFQAAVEMGCDIIETDVRMTKDGHLILIHDRDVTRTTNGSGFVDEMNLEEIQSLDAGGWKSPAFAGVTIPTAEEFLDYVSKTNVLINWELKEYPMDLGEERALACVDKLVELIERYDMTERSMFNSFSDPLLEYVADTWGDKFVIHGYLYYKKPRGFSKKPVEQFYHWSAIWDKPEGFVAGLQKDYDYANEHQILTCILVPDREEYYQEALDMGCRMFTSDAPAIGLIIVKKLISSDNTVEASK